MEYRGYNIQYIEDKNIYQCVYQLTPFPIVLYGDSVDELKSNLDILLS